MLILCWSLHLDEASGGQLAQLTAELWAVRATVGDQFWQRQRTWHAAEAQRWQEICQTFGAPVWRMIPVWG